MSNPTSADYGWVKGAGISLLEKIRLDLKAALRNRDHGVRDTLRQIMSEFPSLTVPIQLESGKKTTRLKKPEEITDDDILDIIRKLVKSEKIVLEAKKETSSDYLQTLERYLPRMATREEIAAWVRANIILSEFKSPLQAMGPVMKHFGKQADGSLVKQVLQEIGRG
ncbi:MAG: GatB/YqeY domain-containing protein [Desulfobacterales bacterium]|nr:GatB/YqeY domain-containing protein [Desulfobacterales bacterium]